MIDDISNRIEKLQELCEAYHVRRFEAFGSATRDDFDAERSDLDFLVVFDDVPGVRHADQHFGLLKDLEDLFGRSIDLVELFAVWNPFFLQAIRSSRVVLYDAA